MGKGNQGKKKFIDELIPPPLLGFLKNERYMSIGHNIYQATAEPYGDGYMLDFIEVQKEFLKDITRKPGPYNPDTGKYGKSVDSGVVSDIYKNFNYDKAIPIPHNIREGFPFVLEGTIWNSYNYPPTEPIEVNTESELEKRCANTMKLFRHIYRDSLSMGLDYATVEFMHPRQKLPVQVLFSKENKTAKSTILNHRKWIYGSNGAIIDSATFDDKFNDPVVGKNFIGIDEGKLKDDAAMEKIKMRVTSPTMPHRAMRQAARDVPNFGKWFIATNKEKFASIQPEDSRFWMIQCYKLQTKYDPKFEQKLKSEIPYWIGYLKYRWDNRFSKNAVGLMKMDTPASLDRLWFTETSYDTEVLGRLKLYNKTKNCKIILDELIAWFEEINNALKNNGEEELESIQTTAKGIKVKFFNKSGVNISIPDVKRILEDELDLNVAKDDNGNSLNTKYIDYLDNVDVVGTESKKVRSRNIFTINYAFLIMSRFGEDVANDTGEVKKKKDGKQLNNGL